jgi:hydroxybutyrate-dimer hydrolase
MNKLLIVVAAGLLASCGGGHHHEGERNAAPAYLGAIAATAYDGAGDDLLTGGLGKTGIGAPAAPAYADPLHPTAAELRRNAIYANYRAIVDVNPNSGYGTLYGPNVDAAGAPSTSEGKVAGTEYIAYADDGSGRQNVSLMVQVPDRFDPLHPCIVTGASSGSRGIYGAIGTSGEWGLKNGCAVAYTDKGTGIGLYTFDDDSVNRRNGVRATRATAGADAVFAPALGDAERGAFATAYPDRLAFKHAHSQQNPERDWGRDVLRAVEFAYYVLNEKYGDAAEGGAGHLLRYRAGDILVIASSISNGGGAALLAAEQDSKGLISGVAVSEPQIQPKDAGSYTVLQGGLPVGAQGKTLFDYATYAALYQPCIAGSAVRCFALAAKGLLAGGGMPAQQADAYTRMHAYGWQADSDILQAAHTGTTVLVAVAYANAYGRFAVNERVCGFGFAQADAFGEPTPFAASQRAQSFAAMNGIPGSVVYEDSVSGGAAYTFGVSPSTRLADQSLDGFLCLRALATGVDPVTRLALSGALLAQSQRVLKGIAEVLASGDLGGRPAVIVQGRADTLVPVNHASRAYLGLNAVREGVRSKLRYVEVSNANHFDTFTSALPTVIVPLHVYLFRALDAVYANLRSGKALPPSQVVATVPRNSGAVPITQVNVPPIAATPRPGDAIMISGSTVSVPN